MKRFCLFIGLVLAAIILSAIGAVMIAIYVR